MDMGAKMLGAMGATAVAAALAVTAAPTTAQAAEAAPLLPAPVGLSSTRAADDVNRMVMSWNGVQGADFYRVNTLRGSTDTVTYVPAATPSYAFDVVGGACTSYKLRVSSVGAGGVGEYTDYATGRTLPPSAVLGMTTGRDGAEGEFGTVVWR